MHAVPQTAIGPWPLMYPRLRTLCAWLLVIAALAIPLSVHAQEFLPIGQARRAPNGHLVTVSGVVIYGSPGYKGGFIIESANRSAGIVVVGNRMPLAGEAVTVTGTTASLRGERALINATVPPGSPGAVMPAPFATRLSWLPGDTALSPRNILLRVYGKVTEVGTGCLYINDGSLPGRGVKVLGTATGVGPGDGVIGSGIALVDTADTTENSGVVIIGWSMGVTRILYAGRQQPDIVARWNQLMPAATGSPYSTAPSWVAPFVAGSLTPQFQQDGINMMNFMRYIAGVPDDVVGEPAWYDEEQHGAVILKALGYLSHTPPKPSGMTDEFYALAYSACSSSNLAYGWRSSGGYIYQITAAESVTLYMDDSGGNESTVGHRRWVLNPSMKKTAFGWCESFSGMKAFDTSRSPKPDYLFVAWPAPGAFPLELSPEEQPWSVTLNPSYYSYTGQEDVILQRLSDGAQWHFSATSIPYDGFFTVNTQGYGVPYCVIFRPETTLTYLAGDTFSVTLSGLRKKDGTSDTLSWQTGLFSLPGFQHYYYRR